MKRTIIIAMLLITIGGTNIQCGSKPATSAAPNISSLLGQLTNAINPSAFTDAFASSKSGFLDGLSNVTNAGGIASTISSLAGFIKPEMFKTGITPQTIADGAGKVASMAEATGLLKNFEGSLKPEAFVSDWASKRSGWLNALDMLK
ncbi:MAG TPA: hypothetical protein VFZ47_03750 [Chitinophagaceae bacterium]